MASAVGPAVTMARLPARAPPAPSRRHDRREDRRGLRHPARAKFATGHRAFVGTHEAHAIGLQGREIPPGRRVLPAIRTFIAGAISNGAVGGEQGGGGEVAREPVRRLGHQVGVFSAPRRRDRRSGRVRCGPSPASSVSEKSSRIDLVLGERRPATARVTNSAPAAVRIGRTATPALQSRRVSSKGLIGCDAAADDQQNPLLVQGLVHPHRRAPALVQTGCLRQI